MASTNDEVFRDIFAKAYVNCGLILSKAYNATLEAVGRDKIQDNSASQLGGQLLKKKEVQELVDIEKVKAEKRIEEKFDIERQKIINAMWITYDKAMEEQVTFDRNGKPLDKYDVNSISGANKSLELLAKTSGLLIEKVETKNDNNQTVNGVIEVEIV